MCRNRLLLAMLLGACLPGVAMADWMRDYDRGLKALKEENWQEAESGFRAAMREKPDPQARQRFQGQRYEPYLPQYYAGLAAWRQGNCSGALEYWEQPKSAATIGQLPELKSEQERGVGACRAQLAAASAPAKPTAPAPSPATSSSGSVASTTTGTAPSSSSRPASTPATTTPAPPPAAKPPVTTPSTPVASRPSTPAPAKPAPTTPSRVAAPAVLKGLVDAYLAGRYADLDKADPAKAGDTTSRAQLLMLRAAARYLQAELDGRNGAAFDPARSDVRLAKAANASLAPDAAMFPPRFRSFWQQTR